MAAPLKSSFKEDACPVFHRNDAAPKWWKRGGGEPLWAPEVSASLQCALRGGGGGGPGLQVASHRAAHCSAVLHR
ncbi:unnamed protein product [Merluccius merluccius]